MATQAKRGIDTGLVVEHPLSHEQIPLWVGNYVLMGYGDGAVMGVPAHDERDFAFAKKYGIDMLQVVHVDGEEFSYERWQDWYADTTLRRARSTPTSTAASTYEVAVDAVAAALEHRGLGGKQTTWRLRDWGISRQRYWGTPIPIIHCEACGVVPVPEKDLPVVLPEDLIPDGSRQPARQARRVPERRRVRPAAAPRGARPTRWTPSSTAPGTSCATATRSSTSAMVGAGTEYWMPMDQYIGGIEHAILHLLYARFWTKVMRDMKLVDDRRAVHAPAHAGHGAQPRLGAAARDRAASSTSRPTRSRRSKSDAEGRPRRGGDGWKRDGSARRVPRHAARWARPSATASTRRTSSTATAPTRRACSSCSRRRPSRRSTGTTPASRARTASCKRLWKFAARHADTIDSAPRAPAARAAARRALRHEIHSVLRQVSYDYERMQYNTVVSGAMKLLNALEAHAGQGAVAPAPLREGFGILLRVLYPVCPHTTWALWNELGFAADQGALLDAPWPQVDESALVQDEIELMLQINGKLRGSIRVAAKADKAHIEAAALATPEFAKFAEGRPAKKVDRRARPPGQRRRLMRRRLLLGAAASSRSPAAASS